MAIYEVDDNNFKEVLEREFNTDNIVILKFGSEFCEPCYALESELEELDEMSDNISILSLDCVQAPDIAEEYDIFQFPTMIIYKSKDNIIYKCENVVLADDIQKIINES
ncbi:MAG: thioredoxin domain-containing protein [Campylobacterota bacterium]|nr:thioredoxin domain-containing protein [Campylobacterota bacterium]